MQNSGITIRFTSLHGSQTSPDVLSMLNNVISIRITSLYGSHTSPVDLWMRNSMLRSRMTIVYWSQPLSKVFCIQNNVFSIRMTCLYGSQLSSVVCAFTTATLWPELRVSMCPRPHLSFCACKTAWLASEWLVMLIELFYIHKTTAEV